MRRLTTPLIGKLRAKLSSADGETLVETLVATLIMSLVMLMLCTAIVSAAKVNASFKADEALFNQAAEDGLAVQPVNDMKVTITPNLVGANPVTLSVGDDGVIKTYKQNGYYYYEPAN